MGLCYITNGHTGDQLSDILVSFFAYEIKIGYLRKCLFNSQNQDVVIFQGSSTDCNSKIHCVKLIM